MNTDKNEVKMEHRGETEVVFTRYFDAPRELVFDCHTKPDLMRRWLIGPEGMVLETCEQDLKVGGKYLYLYMDAKGNKSGVYGSFREVIVPERLANTENYIMDMSTFDPSAPENPNATFESRTFTTEGNRTLMTHLCRYASAEVCKMMVESGAADGMAECYLELDKLLVEIV
ncbi:MULTISPECIES: SRPBCC family protein [Leptospira]|uniref:ATPase n=1 Tax=Leptospira bandrabouensis TaxID=2484903 RepID=A0A6H3P004_9LEPT|nr:MULTISPECIES: SRPBCC family protein [Leptospira]MCG6140578.1 SRPBCC family protein [Leptospira mtsangambouensis]MCG6144548.1 SRPBCC family protein [Leptospira bandrabouensis]MCG6150443.1 SRPBCC family protein [Leptospira bandrabouensis]MCG6160209.1 SRPBCC family protein [Leptospira bandrabouensis]MCG6164142.1 SRPBCC family protein [Leptospira bandrabouensis]